MKGIAHFISGVTVASFCPWAVEAAQNGDPTYFILGAVAGILPDTIDFKFYRFFYPHDVRIEPDQTTLDPQPIADAVAAAVSAAAEGKITTLKLSTIKMGADDWRQYRVKIDPEAGEVRVQFGPVVSTGQVPQPDTLPASRSVGLAKFSAPILQSYEPTYTVDIFDGPSFKFTRNDAGQVEIDFLPWHRNWSHSLTVGALLAGIASFWTWHAGVVIFGAYVIHVIEDQMGHMGSNLFFPFTKKRAPGLKIMHSGDAFPNFAGVWLCCLLIFWNVYAAIPNPLYHFTFVRFMMTALVIPFAIFGIVRWLLMLPDKGHPESIPTSWDI
ncbi:MAG: metal-dependent hydrolase [Verrucomicrobia bacterium]|nr:metal-dependent hydrolase [Verrucomicrobiota bacterium]